MNNGNNIMIDEEDRDIAMRKAMVVRIEEDTMREREADVVKLPSKVEEIKEDK